MRLGASLPESRNSQLSETSVWNYDSSLCNISEKRRFRHDLVLQGLVWLCMIQFRTTHFAAVRISTSYANLRLPHIYKSQI